MYNYFWYIGEYKLKNLRYLVQIPKFTGNSIVHRQKNQSIIRKNLLLIIYIDCKCNVNNLCCKILTISIGRFYLQFIYAV